MKTIFLFGAGASFGSGACIPTPPPLGNDIKGQKGLFSNLIKLNGVASKIEHDKPELAKLFKTDFEAGMAQFDSERQGDIDDFLREISSFFFKFRPGNMNLYIQLLERLKNKLHRFVFVTTNYDLLIEHAALNINFPNIKYALPQPDDKKDGTPRVHILKIHGSPNFIPDNPPIIENTQMITTSTHYKGPCKPVNISEAISFIENNDSLAPAIAIYDPSKQVRYCPDFVIQQQNEWKKAINEAKRCIIIGLKVHVSDDHIWGELAKSKCDKYYVGDNNGFSNWISDNDLKNCYYLGETFSSSFYEILKTTLDDKS